MKPISDLVHKIEGYSSDSGWEVLSITKEDNGTFSIQVQYSEKETQ